MTKKTMTCAAFTKAVDTQNRTVEQIVSVFNNLDLVKDRVLPGAFTKTLQDWADSPNVMSAYFSHQWDNPFANIGAVIDAKELMPGDTTLPNDQQVTEDGKTLRDLGGLWVKYQVDPAGLNPTADQVFHLLETRRMTQASFAYDVEKQRRNSDGTVDLMELKVHEVGPTLLGANPATTLLTAKSLADLGVQSEVVDAITEVMSKDIAHTFLPSEDDPTRCGFPGCGKTQTAVAHINRLSAGDPEAKATVTLAGSLEERQNTIFGLAQSWASETDTGNGGYFATHLEATFEDRAVFMVEGWDDPWGQGEFFEASVTANADGTLSLGDPAPVNIAAGTTPKSRRKALSSAAKQERASTMASDAPKPQAKAEAAGNAEGDRDEGSSESTGEAERAVVGIDLLLAEL